MKDWFAIYCTHDPYEPPELLGIFDENNYVNACLELKSKYKMEVMFCTRETDTETEWINVITHQKMIKGRYDFPPETYMERIRLNRIQPRKVV